MAAATWQVSTILVTLVLVSGLSENNIHSDYAASTMQPIFADEEYIRHIHSMVNAYRGGTGRLVVETNALINTKYRTWKRNADIINSLLALPKGMDNAGR